MFEALDKLMFLQCTIFGKVIKLIYMEQCLFELDLLRLYIFIDFTETIWLQIGSLQNILQNNINNYMDAILPFLPV